MQLAYKSVQSNVLVHLFSNVSSFLGGGVGSRIAHTCGYFDRVIPCRAFISVNG